MSQLPDWMLWAILGAVTALVLFGGVFSGYALGVKDTIREAQRSAVIAGAARWTSNRETGEAEFNYIQCLNPGVK